MPYMLKTFNFNIASHLLSFFACLALTFGVLSQSSSQAQGNPDGNLLSLGTGIYDVGDDDDAGDFRLEHRWGKPFWWELKPFVGGEVTSEASFWLGGGVYADFWVSDHLIITPSFGVGAYDEGDSDLDLGFPIEFRSQIEAAYQFQNNNRVGVAFGHISNASLDEDNPGTEILNLYWHIPY